MYVIRVKGKYARKKFIVPCFLNEWKGKAEIYPIHQALSSPTAPFELIEALLFAYPEGVQKKESSMNRNCLHIAIRAGISTEIVTYLVDKYPSLVLAHDSQGRLPLHYAISNFAPIEVVRKLISVYPKSIMAPDTRGWTSVHVAVSKCVDPVVVRLLVSICPEAVTVNTKAGSNLLKIIELCPTANSDIFIDIILDAEEDYFQAPIHTNFRQLSIKTSNFLV